MTPIRSSRLLVSLAALVAAALAAPGLATAEFPAAIRDHLGLDVTPQCTLCHADNNGGAGTVTRPFGESMIAAGVAPSDVDALRSALDRLENDGVDSDGDGVGDIDELSAGTDPNVKNKPGDEPLEPVRYGFGCGAGAAGGMPLCALAVVLAGLSPRRRRRLAKTY